MAHGKIPMTPKDLENDEIGGRHHGKNATIIKHWEVSQPGKNQIGQKRHSKIWGEE